MQAIAAAEVPPAFPLAVIPVGKANDVSRVSGWGPYHKANWAEAATVPDLLSAVAVAPEVSVDYWRVRLATLDKTLLKDTPFGSTHGDVRPLSRALLPWLVVALRPAAAPSLLSGMCALQRRRGCACARLQCCDAVI